MVNSKADSALSELAGLGYRLPNPHLLIAPYIRREAVLSSRIEGTRASLSDILLDEVPTPATAPRSSDIEELGILRELTSRKWGRLYRAEPIWRAVALEQADEEDGLGRR